LYFWLAGLFYGEPLWVYLLIYTSIHLGMNILPFWNTDCYHILVELTGKYNLAQRAKESVKEVF